MTDQNDAAVQIRYARVAGFVYLLLIVLYVVGQVIISLTIGKGDFAQRLTHIAAGQTLYRVGLVMQLLASLFTVVLAHALYEVLRPVNERIARLALYFRLGEAFAGLITFVSFTALSLQSNPEYLKSMGAVLLGAVADLVRSADFASFNVTTLFFSFGSTLFFWLFLKTRYIPRVLSAFGVFASIITAMTSVADLIVPAWAHVIVFGWGPIFVAEIMAGLWLLIRGVKIEVRSDNGVQAVQAVCIRLGKRPA